MTIFTQKLKWNNTIFTLTLMYLVEICFFTSLFQSIYFFFYFKRSISITALGFLFFFFFTLFFLFSEKFKNFFFYCLFNTYVLNYCRGVNNFLTKFSAKKPLFFFILVHTYFCLCFLHFLFYWNSIWDLPTEYLYNLFNFIRLLIFPLIILSFVLRYAPFPQLPPELVDPIADKLGKLSADYLEFFNHKKNPKVAATMGAMLLFIATSNLHKKNLEERAAELHQELGIDLTKMPPFVSGTDSTADLVYYSMIASHAKLKLSSPFTLTLEDVKAFLTGNPTLRKEIENTIINYKVLETQYLAQQLKKGADEHSMSRLARLSTSDNEELASSSLVPKVPSILEECF